MSSIASHSREPVSHSINLPYRMGKLQIVPPVMEVTKTSLIRFEGINACYCKTWPKLMAGRS